MNGFPTQTQDLTQPLAVIFDVDGVLIDSYVPHLRSWRALAQETGVEFTDADFAAGFGRTSREIIRQHWSKALAEGGEQAVNYLDERKEALYRELIRFEFPAMPGAVELIQRLRGSGFMLGVGSSGPPENVELVLNRLGCQECFDAVVTGRDVTRGKPDPQVFQIAAQRLTIEPARCVVLEDAPAGIEAAHAAAMKTIALLSTGRRARDFLIDPPEVIVAALNEVSPEMINAIVANDGWCASDYTREFPPITQAPAPTGNRTRVDGPSNLHRY